jgi:hypothetical protein
VQFTHLASFASSSSGWITGDLFAMFAIDFCAQLSVYRLSLHPAFAPRPALLILAGDNSRINLHASLVFRQSNVDVVVLPSHTTQVLHPVEAVLRSPMTVRFKKQLMRQVRNVLEQSSEDQTVTVETCRCSMVAAFLNAFRRETIPGKSRLAFEATGFVPFNPDRYQESLVLKSVAAGAFDGVVIRSSPVAAQLLTEPNSLAERFAAEAGRPMTEADVTELNIDAIWNGVADGTLENGRILTPKPRIWMMESQTTARLL